MTIAKRHAALLLLLALLVPLIAACGGGGTTEEATPTEAEAAMEEPTPTEEEMMEEPTPTEEEMMEEPTPTEEEMMEEPEGEAVELPPVDPANLEGEIVVAGSSTVFPLSERMAELFNNEGFGGEISVASIGSGAGFERFCVNAETDISNASRPIKEEEVQACQENGRDPVEFYVGIDALAVTVSQDNDFVEDVTLEELEQLFTTAETWADVRAEWPEEPIQRFSPGTDSGTFDYFVEEVLDGNDEPLLQAANLQLSEDDNILAQGVIGSPYGIGYFGYAYFDENQGDLKALSLNGIEPSAESAESGDYPLSRPLFMYSTPQIMQEKPQVAGFLNYVLTNVQDEVRAVGYFPIAEASINEEKREFLEATGGETDEAMEEEEAKPAAEGEAVELPSVDPANLEGEIVVAGSSTVFPLSERMAELFNNEGFGGEISVASIGSGAGFERFCVNAETDISNASRPIKEEEVQACQENGRDPVEFYVGIDALAVTVSQDNDFVEDVTLEELEQLFTTAETWADVRAEWPEEPIQRFSPGTDSGTFDYFVEEVLDGNDEPLLQAANLQLSEDDNILAQGVIGSPYGIGYFGYAYFDENQGDLKALSLNGIEPSAESAESGDYPLSRPLFMYSTPQIMQEKPQVAGFLNYVLTNVQDEVRAVGYFPIAEASINEEKREFLEATGQ